MCAHAVNWTSLISYMQYMYWVCVHAIPPSTYPKKKLANMEIFNRANEFTLSHQIYVLGILSSNHSFWVTQHNYQTLYTVYCVPWWLEWLLWSEQCDSSWESDTHPTQQNTSWLYQLLIVGHLQVRIKRFNLHFSLEVAKYFDKSSCIIRTIKSGHSNSSGLVIYPPQVFSD